MKVEEKGFAKKDGFKKILMKTEVSIIFIIGILFIFASLGTQNFLTSYNLTNILKHVPSSE